MPIPDYAACMKPLLELLSDRQIHSTREIPQKIADHFGLSEEERETRLPSGQVTYIRNRVGWATTYLAKAGLLERVARGIIRITDEGLTVLAENPASIDGQYLKKYAGYVEFSSPTDSPDDSAVTEQESFEQILDERTPDEKIESAYTSIRNALADDLLDQVMSCSPVFFERLVIDLLIAMGYGGALPSSGKHMGRTGDGGIDGIINEDKLGLDMICIQAKRWKDSVGRPYVQAFAGSMEAHRAKKGVMITTSTFSRDARDFVDRIERKIVLIDGKQLAQLMIDYNIGVATAKTYTLKKIDSDYFIDAE